MSGKTKRHAPLDVELFHELDESKARLGIEVGRRFIGQDDPWRRGKGPATATRCCWPPDSWVGRRCASSATPRASRARIAIACLSALGTPRSSRTNAAFQGGEDRDQVVSLKDKAEFRIGAA